ncbi:MAG: glycoside hydrolase family 78 protein [Prolixibacteraceae bacterium]|nr:glycoside hydrolase family 78 protein [Prolixibacteraceae bacterium]
MKHNTLLLALLAMLLSCTSNGKAALNIKNLQTSIGKVPLFSWQLSSGQRNQSQSAYQIQIANDPEDLKASKKIIWNSGKIESGQSVLVAGTAIELNPAQTYCWRVKIWNQENQESEWSETAVFRTGLFQESDWKNAQWIGYEDMPTGKKMTPGVHGNGDKLGDKCVDRPVVPLFRKEFVVGKKIKEATLYITGLGQYETSINGQKVGNSFLAPGWTNYDKTVFYNSYDVTGILQQGKNAIGAIVGHGFYNINRERYRKLVIAWGNPKLIGQLRIRFTDGTEQILVTGPDWKTAPSPITFTSIYGGEDYDARLEQNGWNQSGFNDSAWKNAILMTVPSGKLIEEKDYPLEIKETFSAKTIRKLDDGGYLYDFAQNASGIVELKVKGKKGQVVRLIPSELITKENQPNQSASGSPYSFSYTLKGDGVEIWRPRFTYYGFRYVKVEGAVPASGKANGETAQLLDLKLLHNRNSTPSAGTFSCSYDLFNRTFDLINWGIKSNLQSVLTDCPHREKLGWLEQTFLMGSSVHFNFDLYQLYSKQVDDMMEAQLENGLVPDIAPEYVPFGGGFRDSPEWGSASVILPWLIYKWYGDVSVMEKAWPMMIRYAEYLKGKSDHHIVSHGLGDWFDYGPKQPGEAQLTPKALTATSIYYYDVKLLSEMASVLKKTTEQTKLTAWADEIKTAFNAKFFNPATGVISTGSQTAMAMPWCVGLIDDQYKTKVMQNLEDSIRAQGKPLTAGDVGFRYLVEALTFGGKSQLLYEMNARDDVPGYGFQLKKGATALTESWPALENVSNNHLMLGHLMDWFYAGLGGISQTEKSVAYKEIVIKPEMVGDLTWAKANYQSSYGEIRSEWQKSGTSVQMNVTIPANTTALIYIPFSSRSVIKESGKDISGVKGIQVIGEENGRKILKVGSGVFSFESSTPSPK